MQYQGAFSASAIKTFDDCPRKFAFAKIEKLPDVAGVPAEVGRAYHEVADTYGKHCLSKRFVRDDEVLAGMVTAQAATLGSEAAADFRFVAQSLDRLEFPESMIDGRTEEKLAFDAEWKRVDWFDRSVRFRAIVDFSYLQPGTLVVRDYKTDRRIPAQGEIEHEFQVESYAFVKSLDYPEIPEVTVELLYGRYGLARRARTLSREDLDAARARLEAKMARIGSERKFAARPGDHCRWCPFLDRCETAQKLLAGAPAPIRSVEDAQKALAKKTLHAATLKALDAEIKAWIEANGAIPADGKLYGFQPVNKVEFPDVVKVGNALRALGVSKDDVWKAFGATKTAIGRVLRAAGFKGKSFAEAMAKIEAEGQAYTETRLGFGGEEE